MSFSSGPFYIKNPRPLEFTFLASLMIFRDLKTKISALPHGNFPGIFLG